MFGLITFDVVHPFVPNILEQKCGNSNTNVRLYLLEAVSLLYRSDYEVLSKSDRFLLPDDARHFLSHNDMSVLCKWKKFIFEYYSCVV